ncbi:hypothetical protein EBZ80_03375 [bacterium]|nr:hypothetical protein [bacterium]
MGWSLKPVLFHWLGIAIPAWHVCFLAASLAAFFCFRALSGRYRPKIVDHDVALIFSVAYSGAIVGALAWAWFVEGARNGLSHPALGSSGGFIGGICCGLVLTWWRGVPALLVADLVAVPLLIGFSVGRIGCFLNGDDYGIPVASVFQFAGVIFPSLGDGVSRHPAQLYESVACLFSAVAILRIQQVSPLNDRTICQHPGRSSGIAMVCYALIRYSIEGVRGDWRGPTMILSQHVALTPPRAIALLLLLLGAFLLARPRRIHE